MGASRDSTYVTLKATISKGFPKTRHLLESDIKEFREVRDRLSSSDGIIYMDQRIVIHSPLRKEVLAYLHAAHQGITGMKARANQCVYWHGLSSESPKWVSTVPHELALLLLNQQ